MMDSKTRQLGALNSILTCMKRIPDIVPKKDYESVLNQTNYGLSILRDIQINDLSPEMLELKYDQIESHIAILNGFIKIRTLEDWCDNGYTLETPKDSNINYIKQLLSDGN